MSIDDIYTYWHFEPKIYYKKEKIGAALNKKLIWIPIVSSDDYDIYQPKGVREADTFKDFDNMYIRTRRSIWSSWGNFEYNILPKSYKNFITRFRQTPTQNFINIFLLTKCKIGKIFNDLFCLKYFFLE